ncbi:MAG TPA: hypothetical protein VJ927_12820 [Actinomycetota bacterium]|nr:hypothetical protein [Actinomycetota bacterium]
MRGLRFSGWRTMIVTTLLLWSSTVAVGAADAGPSKEDRVDRPSINIVGDSQFNPANGVRSGSGTRHDPFVISNWRVSSVSIRDTDAYVVIRDNDITGQLRLNWNGDRTTVVRNTIGDLRVNQNIERTGDATGGRIANNTFGIVGQLRHFDGVFENNTVTGDESIFAGVFSNQAVQFDGFHGSRFRNNTIYGFVDVKLHGHHHGSGFNQGSHYHGGAAEEGEKEEAHAMHGPDVDHTKRYHEVFITNNKIFADGDYALRYTDQAHAGDDRTAPSETNPDLNKSHVHFTRVHLVGNTLTGAGLMVDIFNAKDERHTGTSTGLVDIRNNVITLERSSNDQLWMSRKDGISVLRAVDAMVMIGGNSITGEAPEDRDLLDEQLANDAGIYLGDVDKADIHIGSNSVENLLYGVRAAHMTKTVHWWIHDLSTTGVAQAVYYDNTVENHPERGQ